MSAAYYSVFHLLIYEATEHWNVKGLRTTLGRAYDHMLMKSTSNRILDRREFPYTDRDPEVVKGLREVAGGFTQLQEHRHFADYNLTQALDPIDALSQVKAAEKIFSTFVRIRSEHIVQEYLTLLLVKKR